MRGKRLDLVGQRFGRLVVVARAPKVDGIKNRTARWICDCDCGGLSVVRTDGLRGGTSRSCGCLSVDTARAVHTKHGNASGGSVSPEYQAWLNMRARCSGGQPECWKNYGGRGISVCQKWQESFEAFLDHVGPRPAKGFELDRIDNDRDYEPGNVRWVTKSQNNQNRRTRARVEADNRVS